MKLYLICFILFAATFTANAQIDNQKKSTSIPAIESKKDTADVPKISPSQPINNNQTYGSLNIPKITTGVEQPKKEFSLFGEEFGNPGELYEKQINKNKADIINEMDLGSVGSKTDLYFGDFKTKSKFVYVQYRDYGEQDGDLIRVSVNDEIIEVRVFLTNAFKGFKLELKNGFNKIDFLALDEGYLLPNTAHFKVVDDQGNIIASNMWALSINVKATIIVVKE